MQAIWNDHVVADADKADLVYIERNWYFPPSSLRQDYLQKSPTPYTCPWKGDCQYYNITDPADAGQNRPDAAWSYPEPYPSAIQRVKKDFSGYVAFGPDVTIKE